jgi:hypothetical protein
MWKQPMNWDLSCKVVSNIVLLSIDITVRKKCNSSLRYLSPAQATCSISQIVNRNEKEPRL